jgi:hypothetical protein
VTKDTPPASARQMIDFEGLVNCRDLGGLALEGFGVTRSGVLYRSETPQLMTPADVARAVGELGIGRVVDLRGKSMLGKDLGGSGPVGGDGRGVNIDFLEMAGGMSVVEQSPDGLLVHLLDCGGPPYKAFLEQFVSTDAAVLVHCHTGKDRTGFVVAMTLALAGVRDEDIIADYEMSGPIFDAMMANLVAAGMAVPKTAPAYALHMPSSKGLRAMLARLRADWPTPEAWALQQGIDAATIAKARARLAP